MRGRRGRARRARRGFLPVAASFFALAVTLLTYVFDLGHMVVVAHARCEHGDVVHESHDHQTPSLAEVGGDHERLGTDGVRPGEGAGEHEHCDPFAITPGVVSFTPACPELTLLDAALLPWSVRPAAGVRVLAILSFAPKSSPPV